MSKELNRADTLSRIPQCSEAQENDEKNFLNFIEAENHLHLAM